MIVSLPEMLDARERRANRQRELLEKFYHEHRRTH